jgi:hypothetical protein
MMEEFRGQHRGEILEENSEFWFKRGETCHFTASNVIMIKRVMYMLKDKVGSDFVNEFKNPNLDDYYSDGGQLLTDGGENDAKDNLAGDNAPRIIPEAIVGAREVLNLTTGEVMSFKATQNRIDDQRDEIEDWLGRKRTSETDDDVDESVQLTETDQGKDVVSESGDIVGIITQVIDGIAYVEPAPGMTNAVVSRLLWADDEEDGYPLPKEHIHRVTDEEIIISL